MSDTPTGGFSESRGSNPRRSYLQTSVENRLKVPADTLAAYATNADLKKGLGRAGVTKEDMEALSGLLEAAVTADKAQAAAAKVAGVASERVRNAMAAAEAAFDEVFWRGTAAGKRDAEVRAALRVGTRARAKRLTQMAEYLDAAEGQRAALDGYGLEDTHVAAARTTHGAAVVANTDWAVRDKEAEDATRLRDGAMVPLDEKMRDLQERGRGGLGDRPDLLEILGLPPG